MIWKSRFPLQWADFPKQRNRCSCIKVKAPSHPVITETHNPTSQNDFVSPWSPQIWRKFGQSNDKGKQRRRRRDRKKERNDTSLFFVSCPPNNKYWSHNNGMFDRNNDAHIEDLFHRSIISFLGGGGDSMASDTKMEQGSKNEWNWSELRLQRVP